MSKKKKSPVSTVRKKRRKRGKSSPRRRTPRHRGQVYLQKCTGAGTRRRTLCRELLRRPRRRRTG